MPIQRALRRAPSLLRRIVSDIWLDLADLLHGTRDPMIPPRWRMFVGHGNYALIGDGFLDLFVSLADLKPQERVLDVGCGSGRMARSLTRYLRPPGGYDGFDVVPSGIAFARKRITAQHPNFRFKLADIRNDRYNRGGKIEARDYVFPYDNGAFDVAIVISVFTHMRGDEVRHYLAEIARSLAPGGRAVLTFFLLNEASRRAIAEGTSAHTFRSGDDVERFDDPETPGAAVAFDEDAVRAWCRASGLPIAEPIQYGTWSSGRPALRFQDIVLIRT